MIWTQTFLSLAQIVQLYGILMIVVVAAVWVALVLAILFWRWISQKDAEASIAAQAEAQEEITRLKAKLADAYVSIADFGEQNRKLIRLVKETCNHGRNWRARANAVIGRGA